MARFNINLGEPGVQGPIGPQGPQGPQGIPGADFTSIEYAQTLFVDPNGNDETGNGKINTPFKTIQAAHDYANSNISASSQVIIKINCGTYSENLSVTRPNTHFVGLVNGQSKSTRLSGTVTINIGSSVAGTVNDIVTFENLLIVTGSGASDVVTVTGNVGCSVFFKDAYIFTSSTTAKCLNVNNTASGGTKIEMKNVILQNQSSSGVSADFSNVYYANIDLLTCFGGTGSGMKITNTNAVVYNTRFENAGGTNIVDVISPFAPGGVALVLANSTIGNPNANGNGINLESGTTSQVAQVGFNVGTAAGTGFAVKGVSGAVFINGNNVIVPGTNSKISTAITRVPLVTSLTPA
jgi:hypothetical protein